MIKLVLFVFVLVLALDHRRVQACRMRMYGVVRRRTLPVFERLCLDQAPAGFARRPKRHSPSRHTARALSSERFPSDLIQ